nr:Integrator complex subunit 2 [Polyrhizophydium stewartii]
MECAADAPAAGQDLVPLILAKHIGPRAEVGDLGQGDLRIWPRPSKPRPETVFMFELKEVVSGDIQEITLLNLIADEQSAWIARDHQQCQKTLGRQRLIMIHTAKEFKDTLRNLIDGSFSEFACVVGVYVFTDQPLEVRRLIVGALHMSCYMRQESFALLRHIFTKEIFTSEKLGETAIKLAQQPLHAIVGAEDMSVSLMYHLLKARIFHNANIDIQKAIYSLLRQPIRDQKMLAHLLRLYCECSFDAVGPFSKLPIEPAHVLHAFASRDAALSEQALICFCLLYHRRLWFERPAPLCDTYDDDFIASLCLRPVLDYAERNIKEVPLFAQMVACAVEQCPEYYEPRIFLDTQECATPFDLVDPLFYMQIDSAAFAIHLNHENFDKMVFRSNVHLLRPLFANPDTERSNVIKVLHVLNSKPEHDAFSVLDSVLYLFQGLSQPSSASGELDYWFKQYWLRMLRYQPQQTFAQSMKQLADLPRFRSGSGTVQPRDDSSHVLVVLQYGDLFFRRPSLLPIFLHLLSMSSLIFATKIKMAKSITEPQKASALLAQDSAIVQSLLEHCIDKPSDDVSSKQLCLHIHEIFVNNVASLRLIHFQGYDPRLVPLVVEQIPSMHVVIDMIPELLADPKLTRERFVFTVVLTAHLAAKYPLQKSLTVAQETVWPAIERWASPIMPAAKDPGAPAADGAAELRSLTDGEMERVTTGLIEIMPCLVTLCFGLPTLLEKVSKFVADVQSSAARIKPERRSDDLEAAAMAALAGLSTRVIHATEGINKSLL